MAHSAPMFWYKEVPVQVEAFLGTQGPIVHKVSPPSDRHTNDKMPPKTATSQGADGGVFSIKEQDQPFSFVWRTKHNATRLELIPISCTDTRSARAVSFEFQAPIAPGVHFVPAESNKRGVCCFLVTTDAIAYRINIRDLVSLFHGGAGDSVGAATKVFTIRSVPITGKRHTFVTQLRYIEESTVALTFGDGTLSLLRSQIFLADTSVADKSYELQDLHDSTFLLNQISQPAPWKSLMNRVQSSIATSFVSSATSQPASATNGSHVLAMCAHNSGNSPFLFTLSMDRHVRVWSPQGKLLQAFHIPPEADSSGFVQETIDPGHKAFIGTLFNPNMTWAIRLLVYIPTSNGVQLYVYTARLGADSIHFSQTSQSSLSSEALVGSDSGQFNLVSMNISPDANKEGYTIWGLWARNYKYFSRYLHVSDPTVVEGAGSVTTYNQFAERNLLAGRWWNVAMDRELNSLLRTIAFLEDDPTRDVSSQFAEFVFKAGRFSNKTIIDSLINLRPIYRTLLENTANANLQALTISALSGPKDSTDIYTNEPEDRQEQVKAWRQFISLCAQRELYGATPAAIAVSDPGSGYLAIIKEESLGFITVCDDSEIIYHTFVDKQFEIPHFLGAQPSQVRATFPNLAGQGLRQNVAKLFKAMDILFSKATPALLKSLETRMQSSSLDHPKGGRFPPPPRLFAEQVFDSLVAASELAEVDVIRAMNMVDSCGSDIDTAISYLLDLLTYSANNPPNVQEGLFFLPHESLVAESAQQLAAERFTIAQKLLVLLSVIYRASAGESQDVKMVSDVLQVAQTLLLLKWLSSKTISTSPRSAHSIEQKMADVHVREESLPSSSLPARYAVAARLPLLPALIKPSRRTAHDSRSAASSSLHHHRQSIVESPFYLSIPRAVSRLLDQLRIVSRERSESLTTHFVGLAQRLSALDQLELLSEFLDLVPATSTLSYYRGKVLLASRNKPEEALKQFLPLLACFGSNIPSVEQQLDIIRQEYAGSHSTKINSTVNRRSGASTGSSTLVTSTTSEGGEAARQLDYYMHLVALFQKHDAHAQAVTVARAALDSLATGKDTTPGDHQQLKWALIGHIFESSLAVRGYHAACKAMLELAPSMSAMRQALEVLISTAIKNNDANQLCTLQMEALSDLFERRLSTLARESPLLGKTNLYEVLFSHYIYKGDFRNAASTMCELASRLNITLTSGNVASAGIAPLLSEMGKSYLAAINAMHMLDEPSRWVAIPALRDPSYHTNKNNGGDCGYGEEDVIKRRKLVAGRPPSPSSTLPQQSKLQILKLKDLQKEYALAIAKLRLLQESLQAESSSSNSTIAVSTIPTLSAQAAVYMLLNVGDHESATTLSLMFDLDLSPIFDYLVDHYLYLLSHEQSEMLDLNIRDLHEKKSLRNGSGMDVNDDDGDDEWQQDSTAIRQSKVSALGHSGALNGGAATSSGGQTPSVKALHTLRQYLEKHDSASSSNFKYRAKVIERILRQNRSFSLPPWLTQHYLKHNPEDLIRLYLRYGTILQTAAFASTVIRAAIKPDELVAKHPLSRWLPYSVLDEILQGLRDETARLEEKVKEGTIHNSSMSFGGLSTSSSVGMGLNANANSNSGMTTTTPERRLQELRDALRQLELCIEAYFENVERESVFST